MSHERADLALNVAALDEGAVRRRRYRATKARLRDEGGGDFAAVQTMRPGITSGKDDLLARAGASGFVLACYETPNGQTVWEWRRGDEPRPQFATERVARQWMSEWLDRTT